MPPYTFTHPALQDEDISEAVQHLWFLLRLRENPDECYLTGVELLSHMVDQDLNDDANDYD